MDRSTQSCPSLESQDERHTGQSARTIAETANIGGEGVAVFVSYALTPTSGEAGRLVGAWMDGLMKHLGVTDSRIEANRNPPAKRVPFKGDGQSRRDQGGVKGAIFFIDKEREVLMVLAEFNQGMAKARSIATRAVDSAEVDN